MHDAAFRVGPVVDPVPALVAPAEAAIAPAARRAIAKAEGLLRRLAVEAGAPLVAARALQAQLARRGVRARLAPAHLAARQALPRRPQAGVTR